MATTATKPRAAKAAPAAVQQSPADVLATEQQASPAVVEHPSLSHALAAFQRELPAVRKGNRATVPTKNGGQYTYDYADLTDVSEAVVPVLGRHGLSFNSKPTIKGGHFGLVYTLRHDASGEKEKGFYPLPNPLQIGQQEMGSWLTYVRRYVLCAVTGVAPGGDDDDAQTAQAYAQRMIEQARERGQQRQQRPPAQQQLQQGHETPQTADSQPEPTLTHEQWIERVNAAQTLDDAVQVWRESRATGDAELVDKLSIICQERKQAEDERAAAAAAPVQQDADAEAPAEAVPA